MNELKPSMGRRVFLGALTAGTVVSVLGGAHYVLASEEDERRARETRRPDGRPRLPPGQYLLRQLKPMGGTEGDPSPGAFRLRVHGDVEAPFTIDFAELLRMPQIDQTCDVHCVTKWSALDVRWTGVRVADLVARAKPKATARYLVFEAAAGYTANLPLRDALQPNVLVAHKLHGASIPRPHGPPVRALVPDLYFWKSAKWLQGIKIVSRDEPGYWETRGYHNHADPWKEERYG
ncbi:MAG: molybdopterin-dependent oxidoreductase [Myxococcales bacterium]|jgi:DMSO/TMAO reductase YedYZ molybdopterin-dependent catalytic subunit|nr:molybdopterin-dependent oxidoreductase [Myxococcales bacterium]